MTMLCDIVESFLRLLQAECLAGVLLVPPDDVFEVSKVPSPVVQGPWLWRMERGRMRGGCL